MARLTYFFALILLGVSLPLSAQEIRVAVASNFTHAMEDIARQFEAQSGHRVTLIFGSTGKIYAQIINGAPFDAFFAADVSRPARLEQADKIQSGSRFSYAFGQLVLWSPDKNLVDKEAGILNSEHFRYLAIANPRLAPYGLAAKQVLESKGLWQPLQPRIVRGENIGQTFHFINSGNAEMGFVALSQVKGLATGERGSLWQIPAELYDPIEQQAVQLTDKTAATALMAFVKSDAGKQIIRSYGYSTP